MKAEADAAQANSFRQLEQMTAMFHHVVSQLPAPAATPVPAAEPPAAPAATPTLHQQEIAHAKQRFDEKATFDAAVEAAVEQVITARDAVASSPLRAASYSSAAAPRAPAGFRVRAPPPPPPPTPPAFSYVHSLPTDRLVPVKSATLSMVKCIKIDLVPAGVNTQALAIASFIIAHDTRMEVFLKMDDPTFDEWRRVWGAPMRSGSWQPTPCSPTRSWAPSSVARRTSRTLSASTVMLAGGFPRVLFPPLWCFPPRCAGAVPPCRILTLS